ncbi:hypothetical protein IGL98_000384 [Enterococcus sp. DIV0840]|uniref:hypothetical protein n=1 Tax=Enterococcus TaxID=1350 RepID=UPI001A8C9044|nr:MULTISPECIES: hypothetical protein [Enterococcus]MBO0435656.1 hypothetical protein [Enterococcus sp. DIV0849a]MBO0475423.1 hypothetical protein [Enterococcus ureasiticus]
MKNQTVWVVQDENSNVIKEIFISNEAAWEYCGKQFKLFGLDLNVTEYKLK